MERLLAHSSAITEGAGWWPNASSGTESRFAANQVAHRAALPMRNGRQETADGVHSDRQRGSQELCEERGVYYYGSPGEIDPQCSVMRGMDARWDVESRSKTKMSVMCRQADRFPPRASPGLCSDQLRQRPHSDGRIASRNIAARTVGGASGMLEFLERHRHACRVAGQTPGVADIGQLRRQSWSRIICNRYIW